MDFWLVRGMSNGWRPEAWLLGSGEEPKVGVMLFDVREWCINGG